MQLSYRQLAVSNTPIVRLLRSARKSLKEFTLPAPRVLVCPALALYCGLRSLTGFIRRVFFCEPLFKAYCARYGKRVRTDTQVHWIQGKGDLIVGDDVLVDGKCTICFAARFSERPLLRIGNNCVISHACQFTVASEITIGNHCLIASEVMMLDSSGHPTDPLARLEGSPPEALSVRPITVADNVWIGRRAIILPGVKIGEGSIVAAGAIVTKDVPPYTVVAGNPARPVKSLQSADGSGGETPLADGAVSPAASS